MTTLSIDFETRATLNLKHTGVYRYAQHPDTSIWCMAWAFEGEEPEIWVPGQPLPENILDHIEAGDELRAWNAEFERTIWRHVMPRVVGGWMIQPKMEQWVCSAAEAAAMSLPRSLGECARVTGVEENKDSEGYNLMMRMSRPRKILDDGTIVWWDVEEKKQRLYDYCKQDVRTEQAIVKVLRRLPPREREIYLHTCLKNDRGIHLDRPLVLASQAVAQIGINRANAELASLTGGAVSEVTKTGQLREWLGHQGVANSSVAKPAVKDLLDSELPKVVRDVLELRASAGRSSLAKMDAMLECACDDDQIRGLTLYHGANTGREAGRLVQPHNFPRPEWETDVVESYIPLMMAEDYDGLDLIHHPVDIIVSMLRSMLVARPGYDLIAADYSGIEARVLNILAGQDDMVAAFAQGVDVYSLFAAKLPGADPFVPGKKHPWRQTGKFGVLGCGYGMGKRTAVTQAKQGYGLTLTLDEAEVIVNAYRSAHTKVVDFWYAADQAAMDAVRCPGEVVTFGALRNLRFTKRGAYLYLILPSKRPLVYAAPKIVDRMTPWQEMRPAVEAWSVNSKTRKWEARGMYGGLWVENIVQAVSRDLLMEGNLRAEDAGYEVILDVHDEVVAEVPETDPRPVSDFEHLLAQTPEWATGWPIKAEGWRGKRYRK